jgi:NAD(P)-dependent dehydrogenase (short-subunit alcohol dehydrogenase family)
MPDGDSKVWFITGSSKGFGRIWAEAALERGDRVAATARDSSTLDELVSKHGDAVLPLQLDVDDKAADDAAVARAHEHFGRLDVVVNNAGYGHFGMVEEVTEAEARSQIETNLFGALWITQAALPIMREQGSGHIIQVSSIGGVNAFPNVGLYHASKWGLEGFSQALAQEVAQFGIDVTLIEPIGFSTDWGGPSAKHSEPIAAYDEIRDARNKARGNNKAGDPEATGKSILDIVDAEEPPLRCFFGNWALGMIKDEYGKRIDNWEKWDWVAQESHGD